MVGGNVAEGDCEAEPSLAGGPRLRSRAVYNWLCQRSSDHVSLPGRHREGRCQLLSLFA